MKILLATTALRQTARSGAFPVSYKSLPTTSAACSGMRFRRRNVLPDRDRAPIMMAIGEATKTCLHDSIQYVGNNRANFGETCQINRLWK